MIPGQKLCPKCRIKFGDLHDNDFSGEVHDDTSSDEIHDNDDSFHKEYLSTSMEEMDVSPVKLHAVASHSRESYGERKFQQIKEKHKEKEASLQETVASAISVSDCRRTSTLQFA